MRLGLLLVLASAVCWWVAGCATTPARPLPTAKAVDLKRYAGRWHEIARLLNPFQRDDSDAMAEYSLISANQVKVVNTEMRPDGSLHSVTGTATPVPDSQNARLKVRFRGLASLVPVPREGNYWIIRLAPDYSVALVGTPDRKYLWLLARAAKVPPATFQAFVKTAHDLGFDTAKLRYAHSQQE